MPIRNSVTFRHPADFVDAAKGEGILGVEGATWFVQLLAKVRRLALEPDLCQEDWGVVVFGRRDAFSFWFGLSFWDEGMWVAHVHQRGLLQRLRAAARAEYAGVIHDVAASLREEPQVTDVTWYFEDELDRSDARGAERPDEGRQP